MTGFYEFCGCRKGVSDFHDSGEVSKWERRARNQDSGEGGETSAGCLKLVINKDTTVQIERNDIIPPPHNPNKQSASHLK